MNWLCCRDDLVSILEDHTYIGIKSGILVGVGDIDGLPCHQNQLCYLIP